MSCVLMAMHVQPWVRRLDGPKTFRQWGCFLLMYRNGFWASLSFLVPKIAPWMLALFHFIFKYMIQWWGAVLCFFNGRRCHRTAFSISNLSKETSFARSQTCASVYLRAWAVVSISGVPVVILSGTVRIFSGMEKYAIRVVAHGLACRLMGWKSFARTRWCLPSVIFTRSCIFSNIFIYLACIPHELISCPVGRLGIYPVFQIWTVVPHWVVFPSKKWRDIALWNFWWGVPVYMPNLGFNMSSSYPASCLCISLPGRDPLDEINPFLYPVLFRIVWDGGMKFCFTGLCNISCAISCLFPWIFHNAVAVGLFRSIFLHTLTLFYCLGDVSYVP